MSQCERTWFYLQPCKPQTAFVIPSLKHCRYTQYLPSVCVCLCACTCLYLHWSLLCKKELHWSGSLLSLAMVSKVTSICLNCGRSYKCMDAHESRECFRGVDESFSTKLTFGSASQHFFISSAKLAGQLVGMVSLWTHNNDAFRSFIVKQKQQPGSGSEQLLSAKDN